MQRGLDDDRAQLDLAVDGGVRLRGELAGQRDAPGLVIFAHGSGSSRLSPRNQRVAQRLRHAGLQTLLFDLLTDDEEIAEERGAMRRFDIGLLAERLVAVTRLCLAEPGGAARIGYFGASTGAAAALVAATALPGTVSAIVSRGGRPDLAGEALARVEAPTLLVVGELDAVVIELNRAAAARLRGPSRIVVVPGAGHLFEEPGALEAVAELAADWFAHYLANGPPGAVG
jgi:putative phosphoribosyl transferase